MNLLVQQENFILASQTALEDLANKQSARVLVVSDSHENFNVLFDIIETFGSSCDAFVFCGDGIEDVAVLIGKAFNDKKTKFYLPNVIAFCRGNCDAENYPLDFASTDENRENDAKILKCPFSEEFIAAGRKIFVTHGHKYGITSSVDSLLSKATEKNSDIVFYGHTHVPHCEEINGILFLNPGSCSMPRSTDIPSFAIVEFPGVTERFDVEFFGIQSGPFGKNSFYRANF